MKLINNQTLSVVTALVGSCLFITSASAETVLWQVGAKADAMDGSVAGSSEFQQTGGYQNQVVYTVDPANPIVVSNVALPAYLDDDPGCSRCASSVKIVFNLDRSYVKGELRLLYGRYGSETDEVYLDGPRAQTWTMSVSEDIRGIFAMPLRWTPAGQYSVTIQYVGGGADSGHYIDFIALVERTPSEPSTEGSEMWRIGIDDGETATNTQTWDEFSFTGGWVPVFDYDVDHPNHKPDTPSLPRKLADANWANSAMADTLTIDFNLAQSSNGRRLSFNYGRRGVEVDEIHLDGVRVGSLSANEEGHIIGQFSMPVLNGSDTIPQGGHRLSVDVVDGSGGAASTVHSIDFVSMTLLP